MFRKTLIATVTVAGIMSTASVFAAPIASNDFGGGKMFLHGKVTDAPCTIAAENADMDVDLGQVSLTHMKTTNSTGEMRPIVIKLGDCVFETGADGHDKDFGMLSKADVTFSGFTSPTPTKGIVPNDAQLGKADGVDIQLLRNASTPFNLTPGTEAVGTQLVPGNDNQLTLYAQMITTGASATHGAVSAHINYKLNYF